jgi:hypothetical protein
MTKNQPQQVKFLIKYQGKSFPFSQICFGTYFLIKVSQIKEEEESYVDVFVLLDFSNRYLFEEVKDVFHENQVMSRISN